MAGRDAYTGRAMGIEDPEEERQKVGNSKVAELGVPGG
jgi:hypothetical protein